MIVTKRDAKRTLGRLNAPPVRISAQRVAYVNIPAGPTLAFQALAPGRDSAVRIGLFDNASIDWTWEP